MCQQAKDPPGSPLNAGTYRMAEMKAKVEHERKALYSDSRGKALVRWLIASMALLVSTANAGEVLVAVAANFAAPMHKITSAFEAQTGHTVRISVGSTGTFATQIRSGAPYDVLLAADDETPAVLEKQGLAVAGSRFTYATGRLVLWSAQPGMVDAQGNVLKRASFDHIAIANPKLAPYGHAAIEVMTHLGVAERLAPRIVQGENIAQTYQFVATGAAQLGFVARSQVMQAGGSTWLVPESLHSPIKQDAVVLARAKGSLAATELMKFLKGETARGIIRAFGYTAP
jgi:molybdate transport system substrate-binding protein